MILAPQNIPPSSFWNQEHPRPPTMIHSPLTINFSIWNMLPETTKLPNYLSSSTSRSCQIIEPQLNRGSIHSPAQRSFVWIYFKKTRLYHLSTVLYVIARVLPTLAPHCVRCSAGEQSPGSTQPAISRIPPPHTKPHHIFKTLTWSSSNQNGLVPRIFLNALKLGFLRARQPQAAVAHSSDTSRWSILH